MAVLAGPLARHLNHCVSAAICEAAREEPLHKGPPRHAHLGEVALVLASHAKVYRGGNDALFSRQDAFQQVGRGGFALGAGNANNSEPRGGEAVPERSAERKKVVVE